MLHTYDALLSCQWHLKIDAALKFFSKRHQTHECGRNMNPETSALLIGLELEHFPGVLLLKHASCLHLTDFYQIKSNLSSWCQRWSCDLFLISNRSVIKYPHTLGSHCTLLCILFGTWLPRKNIGLLIVLVCHYWAQDSWVKKTGLLFA